MDQDNRSVTFPRTVTPADIEHEMPVQSSDGNAFFKPLRILFLNGYGSRPGGINPTILRALGHTVVEPNLPDRNFAQSVTIAQRVFNRHQPDIVAGWSRGGAVAMSIDSKEAPLILIAPAWKNWGTINIVKPEVTILHSPQDDLVPFEDSRQLLRNSSLPQHRLLAVGENHRMIDEAAFVTLLETVELGGTVPQKRRAA